MSERSWRAWPALWVGLWLLVVGAALYARPFLPVDETRYLAVAWEMWLRDDFLVPHLNSEPYSHKPPLLFWLMQAGWAVFGVNDWWPRLVAPLFGLACLALTAGLARRLWPGRPEVGAAAPLILLGSLYWALFTTLTMFDMLLAACALGGLLGLLEAARAERPGRARAGWAGLGLAIGLGVLAKGPAILLHVLPAALLAPWWLPTLTGQAPRGGWRAWYAGVAAAVALGAAIGLAWAIPAGEAGGEDYRNAIFWGQTAGRVVEAFDHARPWWWYLAVIGPMLLPWTLWPPLWRALRGLAGGGADGPLRFCLAWFGPAFVVFSLVSGKQLHYLLPDFPALALLLAALLLARREPLGALHSVAPVLPFMLIALACVFAPQLEGVVRLPEWIDLLDWSWAALPLVIGIAILRRQPERPFTAIVAFSVLTVALVGAAYLVAEPVLSAIVDLKPVAVRLKAFEDEGRPIANYGAYHGQYHFAGRLVRRIPETGDGEIEEWVRENPDGVIVTYQRGLRQPRKALLVRPYRGRYVSLWDARTVAADPSLVERGSD